MMKMLIKCKKNDELLEILDKIDFWSKNFVFMKMKRICEKT